MVASCHYIAVLYQQFKVILILLIKRVLSSCLVVFFALTQADAAVKCEKVSQSVCVIDGDTVAVDNERIRIANIDAPEISGAKCDAEKRLGLIAKDRLMQFLGNDALIIIKRGDPASGRLHDRYKRTLATLEVDGRDIGEILIAEKLARPWMGKRQPWCSPY